MRAQSESGLIAALLARVPHQRGRAGPGDDAAVMPPPLGERVITTDALIEGTHFLRAHPPEALGYKTLAVNLSDVAAMGATPEAFLISVALPPLPDGWWESFCEGLGACAKEAGVVVAGGDTVKSPGPIAITITAWGAGTSLLERTAGQPGDVLMVAGPIGRSGVGLSRWLAEQVLDHDPCLLHHLRPKPPLWAGPLAASLGVKCGMDLSDGLATDLPRLASSSGLILEVDLDHLPDDPAVLASPIARAQTGEDYSLAILARAALVDELRSAGFVAIGRARPSGSDRPCVIWRLAGEDIGPLTPTFGHFLGDLERTT